MSSKVNTRASVSDKRQAILRSAVKVFARKGYFNSKVSDIAANARIADGTVYLYFKSKEEILHSIFDRTMDSFITDGKNELEKLEGAKAKLRKIAELHLEKLGADRNLAIVFQVQLRGSIKFMREFSAAGFSEYLEIISQTIKEGQKEGVFKKDLNATISAKIFFGALDEMVTNWVLSSKKYELKPAADEVLKLFSYGILK
ncbi:MAG: TetR/AcrR family transcriptional regulator [Pyrinomonadaceae bacterium]